MKKLRTIAFVKPGQPLSKIIDARNKTHGIENTVNISIALAPFGEWATSG
jgi:hypothetical protein